VATTRVFKSGNSQAVRLPKEFSVSSKILEIFRRGDEDAAISVITWGELVYGAEKSKQRKKALQLLAEFKSLVPVLPIPESTGDTYGAIRALLESKGTPIVNNDLWIAAHAKAAALTLVTNNEREFQRVPGLKIQNWVG